eukprot:TRINITY_DN27921_c0_g1_i1.p1 TRINITY_DN27921_c0_g1~~TRINITY_DN27921_c0_g1_i1.p1  ORF type:complete len:677 (-),score=157.25 TRINITY_DN27921_c0_g1_i1:135-2165(-)
MYISYLEIYNNDGYDLLSREDSATKLEDLPKVQLREDEEGNTHLRNLSVNMAAKAEDALNLLFLGDTNRVVAETPMNDASTRSHCMFIMWVDSTKTDSDTVRRAKLHLVDLAGSERISKTGVEGTLQKEARYINLSLHYLEQVIVALHDRKGHVPYRNSMMTSVLRDSLGGNCKTVMVGAAAVEDRNVDEAISTCRFAQRVAAIKNNAIINEELDPALLIRRLKKEVAELKDELTLLNSGDESEALTDTDREDCQKLVQSYLAQQDVDAPFACGSMGRFMECFKLMRQVYWQRQAQGLTGDEALMHQASSGAKSSGATQKPGYNSHDPLSSLETTVLELRHQVVQRDQEISMLVGSLSKRNTNAAKQAAQDGRVFIKAAPKGQVQGTIATSDSAADVSASAESTVDSVAPNQTADSTALLLDRNKAFELFRKSVRRSESLEDGREVMKQLVTEAKSLGERANAARTATMEAANRVKKAREKAVMNSSPRDPDADDGGMPPDTPEVLALLKNIEEQKNVYKQCTERLKVVKAEIDRFKAASEQNKERLQKDFEAWYLSLQASQMAGDGVGSDQTLSSTQLPHSPPSVPQSKQPTQSVPSPSLASQTKQQEARASPKSAASSPSSAETASAASGVLGRSPSATGPSLAAAPPANALTGHQQTDDDIAAYFAAIANLQK